MIRLSSKCSTGYTLVKRKQVPRRSWNEGMQETMKERHLEADDALETDGGYIWKSNDRLCEFCTHNKYDMNFFNTI